MMEFFYKNEVYEQLLLDLRIAIYRDAIPESKGDVLVDMWLPFLRYLQALAVEAMGHTCGGYPGGLLSLLYSIGMSMISFQYIGFQPAPHRGGNEHRWSATVLRYARISMTSWRITTNRLVVLSQ